MLSVTQFREPIILHKTRPRSTDCTLVPSIVPLLLQCTTRQYILRKAEFDATTINEFCAIRQLAKTMVLIMFIMGITLFLSLPSR